VVLERPDIGIRYRRFSFDIEGKNYDIVPDIVPYIVPDIIPGSMEGLFLASSLWRKLWHCKNEGAGIQSKGSCNASAPARGSCLENGRARAMNMIDNGI